MKRLLLVFLFISAALFAQAKETDKMPSVLGGVVRSDKWTIKREIGEEIFEGKVSYRNANYNFKSDYAIAYKNQGIFKASGKVEATYLENGQFKAQAFCDKADYNMDKREGVLTAAKGRQVLLKYKMQSGDIADAYADKVYFYDMQKTVKLMGSVHLKNSEFESKSDSGEFNYTDDSGILYGNVMVKGKYTDNDFAVVGSSATIKDFEVINFTGDVKGWAKTEEGKMVKYGASGGKH